MKIHVSKHQKINKFSTKRDPRSAFVLAELSWFYWCKY